MSVLDDDLPIIDMDDEMGGGCARAVLLAILGGCALWIVVAVLFWWIGETL